MDKLKMHTPNKADENYMKLATMFPKVSNLCPCSSSMKLPSIASMTKTAMKFLETMAGCLSRNISVC